MENKENSYITLSDLWEIFVKNFWFFVASVFVCASFAVGYIAITQPTYRRTATVLIKDEQQGQSVADAAIASLGLVQPQGNIHNEINLFTTPIILEEVVERLSLHHSYNGKLRGIRWVDLYKKSPFAVELDSLLDRHDISFALEMKGENDFYIDNLTISGKDIDLTIDGVFNTPIATKRGSFTVRKNEVIKSEYEDEEEEEEDNKPMYTSFTFSKGSIAGTARAYAPAILVELREEFSSILDLSIELCSVKKAEDVLNTLIAVYNENWINDQNIIAINTNRFIDERLLLIEQELGEVDKNISTYKSENLLPDLGVVAGMNLQSSNEILKQQIQLNNQLSMAEYILQYMQKNDSNSQLLPANSGIESKSIGELINTYNELVLEKNTLLANSSENNPIIVSLISDIESLKQVLILSINDLISTLNLQIENTKKEELLAQKKLSNNPSQELFLLSSGREQMIKEQLYLFLLQKREENELSQAFTSYNTKVLSYAAGEPLPVAPRKIVILLLALVVGCAIPVAILILKESIETTVQNKEDLGNITMPFLGAIPLNNTKRRNLFGKKKRSENEKPTIVTLTGGRDSVSESFRVVRTNLDFVLGQEGKCKKIMLTSFNPKSGKSFITTNLAISMATKNSKVLLVEGDFRRGTLSLIVDSPSIGLANYLNSSQININDIICKEAYHPMLDVLPMGVMPPNPTELLLSDRFGKVIKELEESYDYIFFDCPPIEVVPDALIINKFCDASIFVVRAGLMDKRLLPSLNEIYTLKKLHNMSLILNGVNLESRYGYGKNGYSSYYQDNKR